jgi:hypothetical protein
MKKLSTHDRSVLIRLASSLPKGSEDRRAILGGLSARKGGDLYEFNALINNPALATSRFLVAKLKKARDQTGDPRKALALVQEVDAALRRTGVLGQSSRGAQAAALLAQLLKKLEDSVYA